jgi:hypothetical protein
MNNFISSIVHNETLIASAKDGLASLDIANAILLSTWQEQSIAMPLKRDEYQKKLNDKVAHSLPRKKSNIKAHIDMNQSYR